MLFRGHLTEADAITNRCKLALAELLYSSLIWSTSLFSVERQFLSLSARLALGLEWVAGDTVSGDLGRVMIAGVQVLACLIDWISGGGGARASVFAGALVPSLWVLDLSVVRSTISITSGSVMACVGIVSIVLGRASSLSKIMIGGVGFSDTVSGELGRAMIAGVLVLACLIDWLSGGGARASVFAGVLVPSLRVLDLSIVRSTISITSGSVMACVGTVSVVLGRASSLSKIMIGGVGFSDTVSGELGRVMVSVLVLSGMMGVLAKMGFIGLISGIGDSASTSAGAMSPLLLGLTLVDGDLLSELSFIWLARSE